MAALVARVQEWNETRGQSDDPTLVWLKVTTSGRRSGRGPGPLSHQCCLSGGHEVSGLQAIED